MATAEIVAIGTEILMGDIADTNSQLLAREFARHGIEHHWRTVVGDDLESASTAIREALSRADIVVTIAGLGPTYDDITREAISAAVGDPLITDEATEEALKAAMTARNRKWLPSLSRQAMRPSTAQHVPNSVGTAPGILWEGEPLDSKLQTPNSKAVIALPGPRVEFKAMLEGPVRKYLATRSTAAIASKTLRIVGIPESRVEELVKDLMAGENPTVAPYAKSMEVHLRITARGVGSDRLIPPVENTIRGRLRKAVFGVDDEVLAFVVLELLKEKRTTLATAESCTGGMLGERITAIPGSSDAYLGGFITYSNDLKARELGVARADLDKFGAVSKPVARQMAEGVMRATGADYGIGITGVAGPDGGSDEKPVGLVYVSLCGPRGTEVVENRFPGDRELIRIRATQVALDMLRLELMR